MAKRRITHERVIAVADWLRVKQEWIESAGIDSPEVAVVASKELGFQIADSTILRLSKPLGIRLRRPLSVSTRADRVMLLAQAVADLFDSLGEPRPEPLTILLNKGNNHDQ